MSYGESSLATTFPLALVVFVAEVAVEDAIWIESDLLTAEAI